MKRDKKKEEKRLLKEMAELDMDLDQTDLLESMVQIEPVTVQLTAKDFDSTQILDEFPEELECQLCMIIKEDMVECPECMFMSCRDCNVSFTRN